MKNPSSSDTVDCSSNSKSKIVKLKIDFYKKFYDLDQNEDIIKMKEM